jgi:hypothetical protein
MPKVNITIRNKFGDLQTISGTITQQDNSGVILVDQDDISHLFLRKQIEIIQEI